MSEWKEEDISLSCEDILGIRSRWWLFWNIVVKRNGLRITWKFSPPETESNVMVEYVSVK